MNLKTLSNLHNLMNMKKDNDAAVFAEKKQLLAQEEQRKNVILQEIQDMQSNTDSHEIWTQIKLENWKALMHKKVKEIDLTIQERAKDLEQARQSLLQSNGELKGIEHLLK